MRNLSLLLLSIISIYLSGCAYMGDSNKVSIPRAERQNLAHLKVPPHMHISFDTFYPIPYHNYNTVRQVNISPPDLFPKKKPANSQA